MSHSTRSSKHPLLFVNDWRDEETQKFSVGHNASQQGPIGRVDDTLQESMSSPFIKTTVPIIGKAQANMRRSDILKQGSVNSSLNHSNFVKNVEDKDIGALKKELEYQKAVKE